VVVVVVVANIVAVEVEAVAASEEVEVEVVNVEEVVDGWMDGCWRLLSPYCVVTAYEMCVYVNSRKL
jgi:hypothetical protein